MSGHLITSVAQLEAMYGQASGAAVVKEIDHVSAEYRTFIEASPFFVLASNGPEGVDCSPRGDGLRNIVRDPRVSLLFLVPGVGETFRVIGRASISTDPALAETFVFAGKTPRAVIVVKVESVYFQCSKAIIRSKLWDPERHVERNSLPSNGTILAAITKGAMGGEEYDRAYPERLRQTIY